MAKINSKGNQISTIGDLPKVGEYAPDFRLTKTDLSDTTLKDYKGMRIVLNIFVSLDTSVCANSVRHFNKELENLENTVILCVSRDLPYAHNRFCTTEGLDKVITASELRNDNFGRDYGVRIINGPLEGLLSRAVVIINEKGEVIYTEQVPEIGQEPDYEKAINALK